MPCFLAFAAPFSVYRSYPARVASTSQHVGPLRSCPPRPRATTTISCAEKPDPAGATAGEKDTSAPAISQSAKMAALLGKNVDVETKRQKEDVERIKREVANEDRRNLGLAVLSIFVGFCLAFVDMNNPDDPVALLHKMEANSAPVAVLSAQASPASTSKPVLVDFYATWCTNCKSMARGLYELESSSLANEVDFITLDVDKPENAELIDRFQVDGIPHMALVDGKGDIRATLIGIVPPDVLRADLRAILDGKNELPFPGLNLDDIGH